MKSNYKRFKTAIENGDLELINSNYLADNARMIKDHHEWALTEAADRGHLELFNSLYKIIEADLDFAKFFKLRSSLFIISAANGHLNIMQSVLERTTETHRATMIHDDCDLAFGFAIKSGNLAVINKLLELTPNLNLRDRMIHERNDIPFVVAALTGRLDIMEMLSFFTRDMKMRDQMIHTDKDAAFSSAAGNGQLQVMDWLLEHTPDKKLRSTMVTSNLDMITKLAAKGGHLSVFEKLSGLISVVEQRRCIQLFGHVAFREAVVNGHLPVMEWILSQVTDQAMREEIIHSRNNSSFNWAARNGHLAVMEKLIELTATDDQKKMIHGECDYAFHWAAENGHEEVLDWIIERSQDEAVRAKLIHADNAYGFRHAAANGHLHVVLKLIEIVPDLQLRSKMIHANNDFAFLYAARNGHLNVLKTILEHTPSQPEYANMFTCLLEDRIFLAELHENNIDIFLWVLASLDLDYDQFEVIFNKTNTRLMDDPHAIYAASQILNIFKPPLGVVEMLQTYKFNDNRNNALAALFSCKPNLVINFFYSLLDREANHDDVNLLLQSLPANFKRCHLIELYYFAVEMKHEGKEDDIIRELLSQYLTLVEIKPSLNVVVDLQLSFNHDLTQILVQKILPKLQANIHNFHMSEWIGVNSTTFNTGYNHIINQTASDRELTQVLCWAGGVVNYLHFAVSVQDLSSVNKLIIRGFPLDIDGEHGDTALMCALRMGSIPIATALIKAGANLDLANDHGETPRIYITLHHLDEILQVQSAKTNLQQLMPQNIFEYYYNYSNPTLYHDKVPIRLLEKAKLRDEINSTQADHDLIDRMTHLVGFNQAVHDQTFERSVNIAVEQLRERYGSPDVAKTYLEIESYIEQLAIQVSLTPVSAKVINCARSVLQISKTESGYVQYFEPSLVLVWAAIKDLDNLEAKTDIEPKQLQENLRQSLLQKLADIENNYEGEAWRYNATNNRQCPKGAVNFVIQTLDGYHVDVKLDLGFGTKTRTLSSPDAAHSAFSEVFLEAFSALPHDQRKIIFHNWDSNKALIDQFAVAQHVLLSELSNKKDEQSLFAVLFNHLLINNAEKKLLVKFPTSSYKWFNDCRGMVINNSILAKHELLKPELYLLAEYKQFLKATYQDYDLLLVQISKSADKNAEYHNFKQYINSKFPALSSFAKVVLFEAIHSIPQSELQSLVTEFLNQYYLVYIKPILTNPKLKIQVAEYLLFGVNKSFIISTKLKPAFTEALSIKLQNEKFEFVSELTECVSLALDNTTAINVANKFFDGSISNPADIPLPLLIKAYNLKHKCQIDHLHDLKEDLLRLQRNIASDSKEVLLNDKEYRLKYMAAQEVSNQEIEVSNQFNNLLADHCLIITEERENIRVDLKSDQKFTSMIKRKPSLKDFAIEGRKTPEHCVRASHESRILAEKSLNIRNERG